MFKNPLIELLCKNLQTLAEGEAVTTVSFSLWPVLPQKLFLSVSATRASEVHLLNYMEQIEFLIFV